MPPQEEWKPIIDYEQLYEISSFGTVRNVRTRQIRKCGNARGYATVALSKHGVIRTFYVHQLVLRKVLSVW